MSPLEIEILLQFYYSPDGYTGPSNGSPSHRLFMLNFIKAGLIGSADNKLVLTAKGEDVVRRLMEVEP